jgi:aspartyl-tRNA(Asn)/glutamyl-tRNA(Gln) amidotransferase subunit A
MTQPTSVREKAEALLARIARLDPEVNAFVTIDPEVVLRDAERLDAIAPHERGPLHGLAFGAKDLIDVAGLPTRVGSSFYERWPDEDATVVARVRAAGAFVLGKTVTHEFAWGITSENPHTGRVRNPWDPARIAGGSSGGSGAALAAGFCDFALGTDTLGSVRIPAAAANGCGIRPVTGTVPMDGIFPLAPTLDIAGPMANDLATLRITLAAIIAAPIVGGAAPQRVARLRGGAWDDVSDAVARAIDEACATLRELGVTVDDVAWWDDALVSATTTLQRYEAARVHEPFHDVDRSKIGPDVRALMDAARDVTQADADAARATIASARTVFASATAGYGALIAPVLPDEAPRAPAPPTFRVGVVPRMVAAAALGLPALALPIGFGRHDLPLGMQIMGTGPDYAALLALGERYQSVTTWHLRRAPMAAETTTAGI